jgi:hypothetical protein
MKIIKSIIEGIVAITAIISTFAVGLGVVLIVFAPVWLPFIIVIFLIKHW